MASKEKEQPKKELTNAEIRARMDEVYKNYRFSKERKDNVDALRRKHCMLTPEDLMQTFTL